MHEEDIASSQNVVMGLYSILFVGAWSLGVLFVVVAFWCAITFTISFHGGAGSLGLVTRVEPHTTLFVAY